MPCSRRPALLVLAALLLAALTLGLAPVGPAPVARAEASAWTVDQVRFQPLDPAHSALAADGIGSYRGDLVVTGGDGGLGVVNDVGLEDYVRGISEVPPTWPAAALEAQAIAARTYALWHVLVHPASSSGPVTPQICATDACQVYRGLAGEERSGGLGWTDAVAATAGQVLLYQGRVIFAEYGSSDGGQTISGGVPWLPSVADPDDAASPLDHWHWEVPLSALAPVLGVAPPASLVGLVSTSGGITSTVAEPDGTIVSSQMSGDNFYHTLNQGFPAPDGLPLPLPGRSFTVSTESGQAVVDGGGFGNGVGLSQYGALGKALRGLSASDILASYYGGLRPVTLAAGQVPARIRVGLASGLSSVTVSASGPFRVLDGLGRPLAVLAGGRWTVTPAPGGAVEVQPSSADAVPLEITVESVTPQAVAFRVSLPSIVDLAVARAANPAITLSPRLVQAGTVVVPLPPAPSAGTSSAGTSSAGTSSAGTSSAGTSVPGPSGETGIAAQASAGAGYRAAIEAFAGVGKFVTVPVSYAPPAAPVAAMGPRPTSAGPAPLATPPLPSPTALLAHFLPRHPLVRPPAGPERPWPVLALALALILTGGSAVALLWRPRRRPPPPPLG